MNEPATRAEKVELGVELLAHLEHEELSLADAIDRIETITTSPTLTREILDAAEKRGVIERDEGRLRVRHGGTHVRFDAGELGPFGSSCVRKVLGRE